MRIPGPIHLAIALGGAAAPMAQFVLLGGDWISACALGFFTGSATGTTYSFHRVMKARRAPEELRPERLNFLVRHGSGLIASWGCAFIAAACSLNAHAPELIEQLIAPGIYAGALGLLAMVLTASYAFLPWPSHLRTGQVAAGREWPGVKLPWIALTWTALSIGLPAYLLGTWPPAWAFVAQAAFVAGITLPFDVRDLTVDDASMRTVPHLFGASTTVRIALLCLALSAVGFLLSDDAAGRWIVSTIGLLVVAFGGKTRGSFYYDVLLDGLLGAQLLVLIF